MKRIFKKLSKIFKYYIIFSFKLVKCYKTFFLKNLNKSNFKFISVNLKNSIF